MIAPAHFRSETKSTGKGRHCCYFYETEEEHRSLLSTLRRQGSDRDQHTIYLLDSPLTASFCPGSGQTASPIDLNSGHSRTSVIQADHAFVPDELISALRVEIERTKAEGILDLQIICHMPCPGGPHPSAGRIMEFESKLDQLVLSGGCTCTCLYGATNVDPALLVGVMSAHPTVIIEGERCDNLYYTPPLKVSEVGRPAATLRRRLSNLSSRQRLERAQQFLADAGNLLASSLDYETTLQSVLHSAVPFLADWCVVDIVEQGSVQRVAISSSDPSKESLLRELARRYVQRMDMHPAGSVISSNKPGWRRDVDDSFLKRLSFDDPHFEMLRTMGTKSIISVPLVARGCTFGVITFATAESGRRYDQADLSLAEELARRAALAVDNARLYRESQVAIEARDEFLSAASHELKTPVTSLRGFAQLTVRRLGNDGALDPKQLRRALEVIDQQSDRLARLVDQLLDVSRIQCGQLSLDRRPTDIRSLVIGIVANSQEHSLRHALALNAPYAMPALVDPLRLEQVVTNLIDNAIKYSPDGGAISIDLSASGPDMVQITVADEGIGISPEHRQHIFDRFYQAHADSHYGGIGMGLYISRQIVTLHGGHIEVECPPEGGARFVVSLPTNFTPRGL